MGSGATSDIFVLDDYSTGFFKGSDDYFLFSAIFYGNRLTF